ncbi:MAG: hypothetical protein K2X66_01665, partial [Cyanobacteria bacterium]|nr:hypothetical protein [Cyanobacteriota bacterium]
MSNSVRALNTNGLGTTQRKDPWWIEPLLTALVLTSFGIYATLRAFGFDFLEGTFAHGALENYHYMLDPYLSPFCSPNLKEWFPEQFGWWAFS